MSGAVLEAPTLVAGFDDVAVMSKTVEQRGRHFWIVEHALAQKPPARMNALRSDRG